MNDEAQALYDEAIEKVGAEEWERRYKAAAFDCEYEEFVRGNRYLRVWISWPNPDGDPIFLEETHLIRAERLSPTRDYKHIRTLEDQLRLRCGRTYALLDLEIISP